jgi:3-hydroxybutyrate dehydrogenase
VLVNNAGFQHVAPVQEFPPERFQAMVAVMLEAPFRLARAVLPGMYQRGWGRVINLSSVHGLRASPYKSAYVAAKHGLEGLSKVIALEGGPRGVTSNCICPAYVRTPLVEGQIADQARIHGLSEAEVVERVMLTEPAIKRLIEPEEVAEVMLFFGLARGVVRQRGVADAGRRLDRPLNPGRGEDQRLRWSGMVCCLPTT